MRSACSLPHVQTQFSHLERKFCPGWVILSVQEICWKWLELKQDATKSVGLSSTDKGGSTNDSDPPTKFMRFEIIALVFTRLDLDHKQIHSYGYQ